MWTSVPQIDEIFTRMSTSSAVGSGTGPSVTSVLFGAGFSLTAAFILVGMVNPPNRGVGARMRRRGFNLLLGWDLPREVSCLDRVELARPVPDDHEEVLLPREFLVQLQVPRVHAQHGSGVELRGCRHHDHVRDSDPADHGGAQLQVPAPENEPLGPNG